MTAEILTSREGPFDRFGNDLAAAALAFRTGAVGTLTGWPVLAGRSLFYSLIMVVLASLWDRVIGQRLPHTLAETIPPGVLVLYVAATEWITLSLPSAHLRLEDDIRLGGLEPHLLRPKGYLTQVFAQTLGGGLVRMAVLGPTAIGLLVLSGRAWPPAPAFGYLLVLGPIGLAVGVLLYMFAGLMAFWARRVLPFQLVIQKLMFLAGGLFAPVSLYPQPWRGWAEATPFAAHLYWAGRMVMEPSAAVFLQGVGWGLFWIVGLAAINGLVWRLGLSRVLREGL